MHTLTHLTTGFKRIYLCIYIINVFYGWEITLCTRWTRSVVPWGSRDRPRFKKKWEFFITGARAWLCQWKGRQKYPPRLIFFLKNRSVCRSADESVFFFSSVWAEAADFPWHVLHQHSIKLLVLTLHRLTLFTHSFTMFSDAHFDFFHK